MEDFWTGVTLLRTFHGLGLDLVVVRPSLISVCNDWVGLLYVINKLLDVTGHNVINSNMTIEVLIVVMQSVLPTFLAKSVVGWSNIFLIFLSFFFFFVKKRLSYLTNAYTFYWINGDLSIKTIHLLILTFKWFRWCLQPMYSELVNLMDFDLYLILLSNLFLSFIS